jgi:hypothetical protein
MEIVVAAVVGILLAEDLLQLANRKRREESPPRR